MRNLIAGDVAKMTSQVRESVAHSHGRWRTGKIELLVLGLSAEDFHRWYERAMVDQREEVLRVAHPEHFVLHPDRAGIEVEVIENIGETALPWCMFTARCPTLRSRCCGRTIIRFVSAEIVDVDGLLAG